jgi:hypothetical protein
MLARYAQTVACISVHLIAVLALRKETQRLSLSVSLTWRLRHSRALKTTPFTDRPASVLLLQILELAANHAQVTPLLTRSPRSSCCSHKPVIIICSLQHDVHFHRPHPSNLVKQRQCHMPFASRWSRTSEFLYAWVSDWHYHALISAACYLRYVGRCLWAVRAITLSAGSSDIPNSRRGGARLHQCTKYPPYRISY